MEYYLINRPNNDNCEVMILPNELDGTYSFVNLTKGHICSCKFDTIEDATADLDNHVNDGSVIRYIKITRDNSITGGPIKIAFNNVLTGYDTYMETRKE